ncbi:hypothetical protein [Streptomyces sp. NPDC058701]|uniref:hypothetical protein n=1 Tax=Streptomyces sp. NPDC058701 TaxID=3346608 RepID=UPI00365D36F1
MSDPIGLPPAGVDALQRLRDRRDVNTVILRCAQKPPVMAVELEGNLTHEELLASLPPDAARLVVHELAFASRAGSRRHETLLILWVPGETLERDEACAAGYTALKETLTDVRVHLTAGRRDQLDHRRLVALTD